MCTCIKSTFPLQVGVLFGKVLHGGYVGSTLKMQAVHGKRGFPGRLWHATVASAAFSQEGTLTGLRATVCAQLNPGGVLNHKYAGEWAVRQAGVPYAVVRSTGVCLWCSFIP